MGSASGDPSRVLAECQAEAVRVWDILEALIPSLPDVTVATQFLRVLESIAEVCLQWNSSI